VAKTPEKPEKIFSKKDKTNREKDQSMRRLILIGVIIVAALILGTIIFGLVDTYVLRQNKAVARVNSEKITVKEFQTRVRYTRNNLVKNYLSNLPLYEAFATDPNYGQYFASQLQDIILQLDESNTETLGSDVLDQLVTEKIILQEAKKLGITVSEEEITKGLEEAFGFFPEGTPVPSVTPTMGSTSTLSPAQLAIVTITPTATKAPTSTLVPTSTPEATSTMAAGPTTSELPTVIPTITATPTEYTKVLYQENVTNFLKDLESIQVSEQEIRKLISVNLLYNKLLEARSADMKPFEEQVWARHILVDDEAIALTLIEKMNRGEDFAVLAAEHSNDTSNKDTGGDLGWFGKGQMVSAFEEAAWSLEIGEISKPIQTEFGFHIIQVLGHEERPLTQAQFKTKKQTAFTEWIESLNTEETVKKYDVWKDNVPTEPIIPLDQIPAALVQ